MKPRKSDKSANANIKDLVRSPRFIETEEGWFFRTREQIMLGPYAEKFDAEISASLLVARLAQIDDGKDPAEVIHAFMNDPSNATLNHTRCSEKNREPVDVKAIKRRQQYHAAKGTFHKAWTAVTQVKSISKTNHPRSHH